MDSNNTQNLDKLYEGLTSHDMQESYASLIIMRQLSENGKYINVNTNWVAMDMLVSYHRIIEIITLLFSKLMDQSPEEVQVW